MAGPEQIYRLTMTRAEEFELSLKGLTLEVPAGGESAIQVILTRTGYDGPLSLDVVGATGLTGALAVPAGKAGDISVPLRAAADLKPSVATARIIGRATIAGQAYCVTALGRADESCGPRLRPSAAGLAGRDRRRHQSQH